MLLSIAIDGPAGAGKSTIAKRVAREKGFVYVDTGAMYRAMALYFLRRGGTAENVQDIAKMVEDIDVTIEYINNEQQVILNGENVSTVIRTQEVGNMASQVAVVAEVRTKMSTLQRKLAETRSVVMDGRDIGTVVLKDAALKIYLDASVNERARRRQEEYRAAGKPVSDIETLKKEIMERDERDMNREIAPLKRAEDAIYLDSSELSVEEVVAVIAKLSSERGM